MFYIVLTILAILFLIGKEGFHYFGPLYQPYNPPFFSTSGSNIGAWQYKYVHEYPGMFRHYKFVVDNWPYRLQNYV